MALLDSPVLVAFITVMGSAGSTLGAIVLNRRTGGRSGETEVIKELRREIKELKDYEDSRTKS